MTLRTRLLSPIPVLLLLGVAACGQDSTRSDPVGTPGTAENTTTSTAGASSSASAGATGPTASESTAESTDGATMGPTGPTSAAESTDSNGGSTGDSVDTDDNTADDASAPGAPAGNADADSGDASGSGATPGGSPTTGGAGTGGSDSEPLGDAGAGVSLPPPPDVLTVQLQEVRQVIRGFGLNAAIMPPGRTLPWEQLFTLEGPDALGLSILRIGMHETGDHRNVPDDWETARSLGARVIGTCWSSPALWKDNSSTTGGGHLLPERYHEWATRIATYANDHGLYAMSIANDSDFASCSVVQGRPCSPPQTDEFESMVYTAKEMVEFIKVARPIFEDLAPETKLIAPEASSWLHLWSNLSPTALDSGGYHSSDPLDCNCFSNEIDESIEDTCESHCFLGDGYDYGHWMAEDEDAWNAVDILGVHQYESPVGYAWPEDVTFGVRTKEIWQTEMAGTMYWPEQGPSIDIANGVAVARWIHSALTVGEASAWLYWQYAAPFLDINDGLALTLGSTTIAKRYYAMGNFSRFIRPDVFHAVQVAGPIPVDVMVSAYRGDEGEVVIVAINETDQPVEIPIVIAGGTTPAMMTPWVTSAEDNLVAKAPATLADAVLTASLPAMSVTSFVSN